MERIAAAEARAAAAEKRILDLEHRVAQTFANQSEVMRALGGMAEAVVGLQAIVCIDDDDELVGETVERRQFGRLN